MKKDIKINEKKYWRSLDQLAETEEFKKIAQREFPEGASQMNNAWSRRNFMTLTYSAAPGNPPNLRAGF